MRGWTRIHPGVQTGAAGIGAVGRAADGSKGSPAFQLRSGLGARHGAEQDLWTGLQVEAAQGS